MRWLVDDIFIKNKPSQPSSQKQESKHTKKTTKSKKKKKHQSISKGQNKHKAKNT
jgi:hypothetical protein